MSKRAVTAIVVLFVAAGIGALFAPPFGSSQTEDLRERVSVSATAIVEVEPEIARIAFSVQSDAATAAAALERLSEKTNAVVAAMKDLGFTDDDLTVRSVNVFPVRDKDRNVVGYSGRARVLVETEDLDGIGEVMNAGIDGGADGVAGVEFDVKDNSEAVKEALRRAMRFATEKAEVLAVEANRQLGRALTIEEFGSSAPRPRALDQDVAQGAGVAGTVITIIPPDLKVHARIFVTFALQ